MSPLPPGLKEHQPLHDKNSFAIGGAARWYCCPESTEELQMMLQFVLRGQLPLLLIGNGTNLLISDDGWPGVVIHLTGRFNRGVMTWNKGEVTVSCGMGLGTLVKEAVDRGYRGLEDLAGIPGTVGGAVVMNAGAFSSCIADTLLAVTCYDVDSGTIVNYPASALELTYRSSRLKRDNAVVLSARFSFDEQGDLKILSQRRREILRRRKMKQPLEFPNCGSVFKRPPGDYAGTLIEASGLKGVRCGGAQVSEKHANFIINTGNATAADVRHLIVTVQRRVWEHRAVLLEPEVIFTGHFNEPLFKPEIRS